MLATIWFTHMRKSQQRGLDDLEIRILVLDHFLQGAHSFRLLNFNGKDFFGCFAKDKAIELEYGRHGESAWRDNNWITITVCTRVYVTCHVLIESRVVMVRV